ncbi:MAG: hypothetical protein WCG27_03985 [Pseudomonadota bacterium]
MTSTKIIIENISLRLDDKGLRELFSPWGEIVELKIITDHYSGLSRGFALLTYKTEAQAALALAQMNGKALLGRKMEVHWAIRRFLTMPGIHGDDPTKNLKRSPFPEQELTYWLKNRQRWNHQEWLELLESLKQKGYADWVENNDGHREIGLFLESRKDL